MFAGFCAKWRTAPAPALMGRCCGRCYIWVDIAGALYIACMGFSACYGVFTRFICLSFNTGGFLRLLAPLVVFCRVAFPLKCSTMPLKSLVLRFRVFGYTLGRVRGFRAIVGDFRAFDGCACFLPSRARCFCWSSRAFAPVMRSWCARSVRPWGSDRGRRTPCPIMS